MSLSRGICCALLALALVACGSENAAPPQPSSEAVPVEAEHDEAVRPEAVAGEHAGPPEVARPYEEGVDAQAQIDTAVAQAHADGKRVLLMFGANWCVWCRRLAWVMENEPRVSAALAEGWHVVHVDTGTAGSGTNASVVARYGNPVQHGLPCLVVLDGEGTLVHTQETGALESGDHHDPERVLAFLNRFRSS